MVQIGNIQNLKFIGSKSFEIWFPLSMNDYMESTVHDTIELFKRPWKNCGFPRALTIDSHWKAFSSSKQIDSFNRSQTFLPYLPQPPFLNPSRIAQKFNRFHTRSLHVRPRILRGDYLSFTASPLLLGCFEIECTFQQLVSNFLFIGSHFSLSAFNPNVIDNQFGLVTKRCTVIQDTDTVTVTAPRAQERVCSATRVLEIGRAQKRRSQAQRLFCRQAVVEKINFAKEKGFISF